MNDTQPVVYLDGAFVPASEAKISVLDRGFIFGDGVYEVVPVYARQTFRMPQHLARLQRSMDGIGLANPHTDAEWARIIADLVARQPYDDQSVYLQVTRGVAKRDHAFPKGDVKPTVFLMANPLPVPTREQVEKGVAVITAEDNRWKRCDLKTTSLLGNVLMRQLAAEAGAIETIMFRDGMLTEASASNVLVVIHGTIIAPPKDNLILPGITYDAAFEFARQAGMHTAIRPVPKEEALGADELWLTSSTKEVIAVTTVDGRPLRGGVPGPVFRRMWEVFQQHKPRRVPQPA